VIRKIIWNNFKIDFLAILFLVLILFLFWNHTNLQLIDLGQYFSGDRLSRIASFFSIVIGIYIAVMTILASSIIGLTKEILNKRLDYSLLTVIIVGLCENLLSVGLCVFMPLSALFYKLLILIVVLATVSLIKFIIVLALMFRINLNEMAKMIDEEARYKNILLTNLERIVDKCENKAK